MPKVNQWCGGVCRVVLLVVLALFAWGACSVVPSTHKISGDVFVTMVSGDVKRGAGIEVVLAAASIVAEAEMNDIVANRAAEYGKARNLYRKTADRGTPDPLDKALLLIAIDNYAQDIGSVARKHEVQRVRTDSNGHFEIKDLKSGKYFLFTRLQVFDEALVWMVPVDLTKASQKVDLSNHNQGLPAA